MLWLAAALLVLVTMTGARYISQSSSDAAASRAHLARAAENSADNLRLAVQREVQDRLIWEIGRTPAQSARVRADSRATQHLAAALEAIAASAGHIQSLAGRRPPDARGARLGKHQRGSVRRPDAAAAGSRPEGPSS